MKLAALVRAFEKLKREGAIPSELALDIAHTGQHYDHGMNRVFFEEMEIPQPAVNLGIGSGPHGQMTARMLEGLEREMIERAPQRIVTFGDTNSTLAAALAAAKLCIPVAHIEAGLRSHRRDMPEEINRVLTDRVSDLLFCPSEDSKRILASEGITTGVHVVGDVMADAAFHYKARAIAPEIEGPFAFATMHRPDTVDDKASLATALKALEASPVPVVFAAHPRTQARLKEFGLAPGDSVRMIDPLSYFRLLGHLEACEFVLTDSGGLQKEAYYFGKKCITLRRETEWTELVDAGVNRVVGLDLDAIAEAYAWTREAFTGDRTIYGKGDASEKIVKIMAES